MKSPSQSGEPTDREYRKICSNILTEVSGRRWKKGNSKLSAEGWGLCRVQEQQEGKEFVTGSTMQPEDFEGAAEKLGMAAIKYYDLKQNRITDYAFNYDKMLDPKGNTAVYLNYSYVRMCSVLRKAEVGDVIIIIKNILQVEELKFTHDYKINHPYERYLAASLIKFVEVVQQVTDQLALNWLCDYIYDICTKVSESYTKVI